MLHSASKAGPGKSKLGLTGPFWCVQVPLGISIGLSTRLGTLLGEGAHTVPLAKQLVKVTYVAGALIISLYCVITFLCAHRIIGLFTHDTRVIELSLQLWPYGCIFMLMDGMLGE